LPERIGRRDSETRGANLDPNTLTRRNQQSYTHWLQLTSALTRNPTAAAARTDTTPAERLASLQCAPSFPLSCHPACHPASPRALFSFPPPPFSVFFFSARLSTMRPIPSPAYFLRLLSHLPRFCCLSLAPCTRARPASHVCSYAIPSRTLPLFLASPLRWSLSGASCGHAYKRGAYKRGL